MMTLSPFLTGENSGISRIAGELKLFTTHETGQSLASEITLTITIYGKADLHPCFGPTSEWGTAAAHAVLRAAGGELVDRASQPLRYNQRESILNPQFLALGAGGSERWR